MEEKELYFVHSSETNGNTVSPFKRKLWRLVDQYLFRPSPFFLKGWRVWLLRKFGAKIGVGCNISQRVHIYSPWRIEIGNICSIDDDCLIIGALKTGDYVSIGCNCQLIAAGHDVFRRDFPIQGKAIEIGNGAFIGAGTYIGIGVSVGQMSVIGAHSHLTKNVLENTIVKALQPKQISCRRMKTEEYESYRYHYIKK